MAIKRPLFLVPSGASLAGLMLAAHCSTDVPVGAGPLPDAGPPSDGSPKEDAPPLFDGGDSGGCFVCSDDLHEVRDCERHVVRTCAAEQGCDARTGECVPACEAAGASKTSIGCDYYAVNPDSPESWYAGSCYAAFIVNSWGSPVTLDVERDGTTFDARSFAYVPSGSGNDIHYATLTDGKLQPGEVAILFLAANPGVAGAPCPAGVSTAMTTDPALHGTGFGAAFHIRTSAPVVGYDMYPYGGGNTGMASATLLLPSSAWDTNYVAVDPFASTGPNQMPPWIAIVASEDDTDVTLSPTAAIAGGNGVAPTGKGEPQTYTLSKGQVLQFAQGEELVGTPIQSTKPVGVWGGNGCMFVPDTIQYCDTAHQQIPPVRALGYEYAAVRPRDRYSGTPESPPWRFVGAVDGTALTYEPTAPPGAPTTLQSGQMVQFTTGEPFVVRAQDDEHPFYLSGMMTGCTVYEPPVPRGGQHDCRGDPEFVNTVPPQEYLSTYTFVTDPTYPETELVLVRRKTDGAFHDVTLDCAGTVGGWRSLGDYEWTRVDLVTGNFEPQGFGDAGSCDNGRHVVRSDSPFGLTVWGWGSAATGVGPIGGLGGGGGGVAEDGGFYSQAVSYAYPAGLSLKPITNVVVPPVPK